MADAVFNADQLREDIDLEAKRAAGRDGKGGLPVDVWETYSAFANTDGGIILLGVSEVDGQLSASGISEPDRVIQDLWSILNNPQKVSCNLLDANSVRRYSAGGDRWVIEITVPRADRKQRPLFINGNPLTGTYKRQQAGDFRCTAEEVRRMLAEQTEDERDRRVLDGFGFDDLDPEALKAYRNRLAALKPDHPYNSADNIDFLAKVGAWRRQRTGDAAGTAAAEPEGLTLAGLLMFGRHEPLLEAIPHYFVDYREVPIGGSKTQWTDRLVPDGTWSGCLFDFYRLVIPRLFRDLKVPFRLSGAEREDETPVHKALREALVNAIIHADYAVPGAILVVKAPDSFAFRNPGRMRVPIREAFAGGHSDCRNRSLQKMFSLIGLGEQAGSGIPRVIENWKTQHYRLPELSESLDPEATLLTLRTVSLLPEGTLRELRARFGPGFDHLDENSRVALATAQIEGFVTNTRLQQICPVHRRDITELLRRLVVDGFLVPDGQGRATTYRIAGAESVDLAAGEAAANLLPGSAHLPPSSTHLQGRSAHLGPSSAHLPPSSTHSPSGPEADADLEIAAAPVRANRKVDPQTMRNAIVELCRGRFLTLERIASLLDRSAHGLRQRFIKPMVDEGLLERRFPQQPNHEDQAYRTHEAIDA